MSPPSPPWEDVSASQISWERSAPSPGSGALELTQLGIEWREGWEGVSFPSAAPALNFRVGQTLTETPTEETWRAPRETSTPVTHPSTAYSPAGVGRGSLSQRPARARRRARPGKGV